MAESVESLDARVARLERELLELRETVANLQTTTYRKTRVETPPEMEDASEELLTWVGKSSLLPRLATVSFLLVLALILRTVTDNGMVGKQLGSVLGMGYASLLIAVGWYKYRRASALAPVFAVCGALLMFTIVVELHGRFHSIPSSAAYLILILTGVALGAISYFHQAAPPVLVGSLGMCIAGVMIDYPHPFFPSLALLLLVANLLGAFATRLQSCSWLRWILLLVTVLAMQVWGFKLGHAFGRGGQKLAALSPEWFLPCIFLLSAAYLGIAVLAVLRLAHDRVSKFDLALPTITALWGHTVAGHVIRIRWGSDLLLGWIGIAVAGALLGFAVWLLRRQKPWGNSYAVAGIVLAVAALPSAFGGMLPSLPVVAVFALVLAGYSRAWGNGTLRLLSYLVQLYACAALVVLLRDAGAPAGFPARTIAAGLLLAASWYHFIWCRRGPAPEALAFFSRFDRQDRTAVLLFLAALVNGFLLGRIVIHHLVGGSGEDTLPLFHGGESILINVSAAALLWFSLRRRDREIRNVAILMTFIGAMKVFLFDLFTFRGVPLVLAVFSFGLTVSLLSLCLARWQNPEEPREAAAAPRDSHLPAAKS